MPRLSVEYNWAYIHCQPQQLAQVLDVLGVVQLRCHTNDFDILEIAKASDQQVSGVLERTLGTLWYCCEELWHSAPGLAGQKPPQKAGWCAIRQSCRCSSGWAKPRMLHVTSRHPL